jgi:hypothetical protein
MFYKSIVQSVLLYGCETWVLSDRMISTLHGFHHRVAQKIAKKQAYLLARDWIYPPIEEALDNARFSIPPPMVDKSDPRRRPLTRTSK